MENNVIDYIFSAEFNTKSGNLITGIYPSDFDLSLETLLIEKLIPDGTHNFEKDIFSFKNLVPIDTQKFLSLIDKFNQEQVEFTLYDYADNSFLAQSVTVTIDENFNLIFKDSKKNILKLDLKIKFNFRAISDTVLIFTHMDPASQLNNKAGVTEYFFESKGNQRKFNHFIFIMEILRQSSSKTIMRAVLKSEKTNERVYCVMRFLTHVQTKKEKLFNRGAIYKSITIGTFLFADLKSFENYSALVLEDYMNIKPVDPEHMNTKYCPEAMKILEHYHDKQNVILNTGNLKFTDQTFLLPSLSNKSLSESLIYDVIHMFEERFMIIYREIMDEGRVVIFSEKYSISMINSVVEAIRQTLFPINLDTIFSPFETLTGMKLLQFEKTFVTSFNNPLIKFEKKTWTLLVDLDQKILLRPSGISPVVDDVNLMDLQLIRNLLSFKNISSSKIIKCFYNYNKMQISFCLNRHINKNSLPDSDLKESLSSVIENLKKTSFFFKLKDDDLLFEFLGRKYFKQQNKNVQNAVEFFESNEYLANQRNDDITVFFNLDIITKFCESEDQIWAVVFMLKFKNGIRNFLGLIYSSNKFICERFVHFYLKIKNIEIITKQVEKSGFIYSMMLKNKLSEYAPVPIDKKV